MVVVCFPGLIRPQHIREQFPKSWTLFGLAAHSTAGGSSPSAPPSLVYTENPPAFDKKSEKISNLLRDSELAASKS
jgi:hypothetical protein